MNRKFITFITIVLLFASCKVQQTNIGDKDIVIFDNQVVQFIAKASEKNDDDTKYLADGRLVLKKLHLPIYKKDTKVRLNVTLESNGDRWDKSASLFVIPKDSKINFRNISNDIKLPKEEGFDYAGVLVGKDYKPVVELMRFMTPFGVGFYSKTSKRKPVYIPKYEKNVKWEQDVSDRSSMLEGEVWIGIWIDTWTKEGYKISASLHFEESLANDFPKIRSHIQPLANTVAYIGGQKLPDFFSKQSLNTKFSIPKGAKNIQLKYITTGHGGHSGGDEFTKKRNEISIDGKKVLSFIPWRDDCASFRRFNPTSGVWLIKDTASFFSEELGKYTEKFIEERLASSDLSRSNWCPGTDVPPITIYLNDIKAGEHELSIKVIDAQAATGNKLNHWLISAYLYWEE